jgi:hypothetical protein
MSDGNGGNGALYFLVGALCVAVAIGAFFMFGGGHLGPSTAQAPASAPAPAASTPAPTTTKNITIEKIETPKVIERNDRR